MTNGIARGFAAALIYVACALYAHHVALARMQKFARTGSLAGGIDRRVALPPSLWHWDGLVRTERGVYELRMDLSDKPASDADFLTRDITTTPMRRQIVYRRCQTLAEVQKVLWFSRFPVIQFHPEGSVAVVEFPISAFPKHAATVQRGSHIGCVFSADENVLSKAGLPGRRGIPSFCGKEYREDLLVRW